MLKCSFCGHENEGGSRQCVQCKTDLTLPPLLAEAEMAAPPLGSDAAKPDTDVPTLHLDKVPLVESLGTRTAGPSEIAGARAAYASLPAAAATSGANGMAVAEPAALDVEVVKPYLVVLRGEKIDMQYPIYSGKNYMGRTDERPVDIDLEIQEPPDRIWTSRQHAVITFENGVLTIEDLNSLNGTFVNRTRVHPGQVRALQGNDIIQVGTVQMRLIVG
jgi:hypothetical protein